MKVFNVNLYVFVIVMVLTIIISIFYMIIKVERPTDLDKFNSLAPFPTIKMQSLPDPSFSISTEGIENCKTAIISCNTPDDCSTKCGADYECDTVSDEDNVIYNGIKVGKGNWCLPKNRLRGCSKYTGRTVWSANQQGQDWKCECLYPSLFDGPYCTNNKACIDTSPNALNVDQSNNKLVNKNGDVFDPSIPPPGGISNPYARDKDGNPIYTCRCGYGSNNKKFVKLPNDPFSCHLDPCTNDHTSPLWDETNQTCICGIDGTTKDSNGKCVQVKCPYGSWNSLTQRCECMGRMARIRCNPRNNKIWTDNVPPCDDPDNEVGLQCIDRCIAKYCESGDYSKCGVNWDNQGENRGYRPEFCEGATCVVCGAGNCNVDDNGKICCECPEGTSYSPINTQTPGVCVKEGSYPGDGCYHWGTYDNKAKYRFFWVYEDYDNRNGGSGYKAWDIVYDDEHKNTANGIKNNGKGKCDVRCMSENTVTSSSGLREKLNDMSKNDNLRERRDNFLSNYCSSADDWIKSGKANSVGVDINNQPQEVQDKFKSGNLDYVCGLMCDGDVNIKIDNIMCS